MKPLISPPSEPLEPVRTKEKSRPLPVVRETQATPMPQPSTAPAALTRGFATAPLAERPSIGFAELLFRGTSETAPASGPDWAKTAVDAPPTIHPNEALLPPADFVPFWLRAAVFIGGSMVIGGVLAHFSGDATWQKNLQLRQPSKLVSQRQRPCQESNQCLKLFPCLLRQPCRRPPQRLWVVASG